MVAIDVSMRKARMADQTASRATFVAERLLALSSCAASWISS